MEKCSKINYQTSEIAVAGKVVAHTTKAGVTFVMLDQPSVLVFPEREALCLPEFNFSTLHKHLAQQISVYAQVEQDQGIVEDDNRWSSSNSVELPLTTPLKSTSSLGDLVELEALLPALLNNAPLPLGAAHAEAPPGVPLPDQLIACHEVVLALWKAGDYEEAQKLYTTLIQARPDLAIGLLYCNFGSGTLNLLDGTNDPDNSAFLIAVNLQPSLWKNYLNLSWDYYQEGNYQRAIHHLTRLLELRPGNTIPAIFYTPEDTALLYKLRAISFLQLKKYLAAAQDATAALKAVAADAVASEIRGHAGLLMGQWMRSKADFDAAIWMGADSSDSALFSRGLVQLHLGSLANAGQDFGRAFQLNLSNQLAAGFMEQWCNYCLDHKTRGRRLAGGDTAGFKSTWSLQGTTTGTLSPFRMQLALTTSSRSIMANRLQKIATPPHNISNYWSILGETMLEFLRNDFALALTALNRLEKLYNASETPGIAGWSYYYWMGLINLASGQRQRATTYLDRALALGLPPVLLLDGMPLN